MRKIKTLIILLIAISIASIGAILRVEITKIAMLESISNQQQAEIKNMQQEIDSMQKENDAIVQMLMLKQYVPHI